MSGRRSIAVGFVDAADPELVERLTGLINDVYAVAEDGLWRDGATRTTAADVARLIDARELVAATVDGELAGAVQVRPLSESTGEFGLLAADAGYRGLGVGRELVAFAESRCRERGLRAMQLELLVPREWRHPSKVFLDDWYRRMGYRVIRTTTVEDLQPALAPLLATPCEFLVYEKPLDGER
jgi:GNAT superfamily N-acetyltransferase